MEPFKYHMMTLRGEGVCSNRQSVVIWGRRRGLAKSSCNFYSGWKSLNQFLLLYLRYMGGWGGWLKTSEYRHMRRKAI